MGELKDSPVISVPRRLNYFPPIATPATMFQRRKKKCARELYHLSPQNHDLILSNPPVTPWDDPPEFFRTFIGTPDDIRRAGGGGGSGDSDIKVTWPFLRQIGPRCVFKGMRKKTRDDEDVLDIYKIPYPKSAASGGFNERFLEPECIGLARDYASPRTQFFSQRYADLQSSQSEKRISPLSFKDAHATRQESSARKVKAPPPSEARSAKSDDSLHDSGIGHYHISPPFDSPRSYPQGAFRVVNPAVSFDTFRNKQRRLTGERVVRFEDSPLPEKLQQLNMGNPESLDNSEMCKLTWHDIVQAPVIGTLISVGGDKSAPGMYVRRVDLKDESARVPWRFPKSKRKLGATCNKVSDREKRVGVRVSDRDIATWIDDVRKAQNYGGESLSR